jgi:pyoverdine/dityrosine biosynthesis protein Dit1
MNSGSSPFYAIKGLFCRGSNGDLLAVEGQNADQITEHWSTLRTQMTATESKSTKLPSGIAVDSTPVDISECQSICSSPSPEPHNHFVRELYHEAKGCYIGLLSCELVEADEEKRAFRDWLETFFLLETSLVPSTYHKAQQGEKDFQITESITGLFESTLRNVSSNDEWSIGRPLFTRRILDFVARKERIQMGVPAFPCKSPNKRKVGCHNPDMAERLALQTLHTFTQNVKKIYSPGVSVWVISDGHVFSDCIGVDDQDVVDYDQDLHKLYQSICTSAEDRTAIRFRGLTDMFFSNPDVADTFSPSWVQNFHIEHPIQSKRSTEAETARQIMMAGCESSRQQFKKLIADQHPPTLSLYRGQARFMQDDLAAPDFLAKSAKQRKKISFAVAAEMITRNHAYSNLLEFLIPNHVRLSIHAHSNRGPKFGICLFPRDKVHAIDSIKNRHELTPAYEFQVPTPWHNSIIKVVGDDTIYLGKSEIVKTAIEHGDFEGGWVDDPAGGHFALTPISESRFNSSTATECSSTISEVYPTQKPAIISQTKTMEVVVIAPVQEDAPARVGFTVKRGKLYGIFISSRQFVKRMVKPRRSATTA